MLLPDSARRQGAGGGAGRRVPAAARQGYSRTRVLRGARHVFSIVLPAGLVLVLVVLHTGTGGGRAAARL